MYSIEKNASRIYQLYENILMSQQSEKSVSDYYSTLRGMWEESNMYQPMTNDIEQLKRQREKFQVAKFLSGLNTNFQNKFEKPTWTSIMTTTGESSMESTLEDSHSTNEAPNATLGPITLSRENTMQYCSVSKRRVLLLGSPPKLLH